MKMKLTVNLAGVSLAALLALSQTSALAQNSWTGTGGSLFWNDTANWSFGAAPTSSDVVYFEDLNYPGYTNLSGAVNNILDANYSIGALLYTATSLVNASGTNLHFYTTQIPTGRTLTVVGGPNDPMLQVGGATTGSTTNATTITGPGSLVVSNATSRMEVQQNTRATLDLSGLNSFSAVVSSLWVGAAPGGNATAGTLTLAKTNSIKTAANTLAPGVLVGRGGSANANGLVTLGAKNQVNTDGLTVGGSRTPATGTDVSRIWFGPGLSNPTFALRGSAGGSTRTATFSVGDLAARDIDYQSGPGGSSGGNADFSGGSVDILADKIYVGRSAADTGTGGNFTYGYGLLTFEAGNIDANQVFIAYKQGTNGSSALEGGGSIPRPCTLTLKSNVTMTVNQDFLLAFRQGLTNGSQMPNALLNVNDTAILNIGGSLLHGNGGVSTISLNGGTINMTAGGNVYASTLAGSGNLMGANNITVTNSLIPGSIDRAGTLELSGNLNLASTAGLTFNVGSTNTAGASGVNDLVNLTGTGNVSFNNNPLTLDLTGPLLSGSNYHLIDFSGTRSGSVTLNNPTRSALGLDQTTPGHLDLVVTNWSPATLTWNGSATNRWNTTLTNWNTGNTERFYQYDTVVFDDSSLVNAVYADGFLYPSQIIVDGSKNYSLTNRSQLSVAGAYRGFGGITKNGTGTFIWGVGLLTNTFSGDIFVNNGVFRIHDPTANGGGFPLLGSTLGKVYVANGATFDMGSVFTCSPGKVLVLSGNGFNGMGAMVGATGTGNGFLVRLAGDTMISLTNGNLGLQGASSAILSGELSLNGYNLTINGLANRFTWQDVVANNAGDINLAGGLLRLTRSIIDGPGTLRLYNGSLLQFASSTAGYVGKAIAATNATINAVGSTTPVLVTSPIAASGTLYLSNSQPLTIDGVISGTATLAKIQTSTLLLNAANNYTGPTLVSGGTLSLGAAGSISTTPLIQMDAGTTFDVTAKGGAFATAPAQSLNLNGTARGNLTIGPGSTLLGAGIVNGSLTIAQGSETALATTNVTGTLSVSNNLTLAGGHFTWELAPSLDISDAIMVGGNLTLTGTNVFTIDSIGGFDPSGFNTLITYSGTLSGGLTNLALNTPARFIVEFVDPATTPGLIQVRLITPSPNLTWKGGTPGNPTRWDVKTTPNWDNAGTPDIFYSSDLVSFGDSPVTNVVDLVGTLGPGSITMANSSVAYLFRGTGGLVASSLTNDGTAGLVVSNSANNFFTGVGLVLNNGTVTFNQPTNATLTGNLNGPGAFNKAGSSILTLVGNAANFNGTNNVNGGTLRAGSSNAVASWVNVAPNSTLDINGQLLPNATLTVSGNGADGWGAINNRGAGRTNALASVTLAGDTMFGAASNAWGIVNNLQGGGYRLTKTNAQDVWIMTGSETDLGNIDVLQGRLLFSGTGTTLGRTESNILVRTSAILGLATTNAMPNSGLPPEPLDAGIKPLNLLANGTLESVGFPVNQTSTNIFGGSITITNPGIFRVGGNSRLVLNGPISGVNGLLILTNGGTLALYGTNTYTSNTLVYSGTLQLATNVSLPANTTLILSNRVTTGNPSLALANNATFPASNPLQISLQNSSVSIGGDGTWNGPVTIGGANALGIAGGVEGLNLLGTIVTNGTGSVSIEGDKTRIAGLLRFTNSMSIGVQSGLGAGFNERFTTVQFDSQNFWTNTTFGRGRINLGTNNALPPSAPIRAGVLSAGVGDRRLFIDLAGYNQTIGSLIETAVGDSRILIGNSRTNVNSVLTVAGSPTATNTWAIKLVNDLDNQLDHTSTLGLTVTSGTLILLSTNDYTGPTLVTGGRLLLNTGSGLTAGFVGQLGATPVTVSGTGTLGGNGYVAGPVTVTTGGTIAPGSSIGVLTLGNDLTLGASGTSQFEIDLNAGTTDLLEVAGTVTLGGTIVVTNLGTQPIASTTVLKLFNAAAYAPGSVTVVPASPAYGLRWDTSQLAVDGTLRTAPLNTTPVNMTSQVTGGNLEVSWPADHTGWRLESQTNALSVGLQGTWYNVPGSSTTNRVFVPIVPGNPTVFLRLVHP